ncbi:hypothetical protein Tco_1415769, partial [Tanacetum coccineum]
MANLRYSDKHNMVAFLKKPTESVGFTEIVYFLKGTSLRYTLSYNPTIYDSLVKQFWQTATVRIVANGIQELVASVDNKEYTITEASIRSQLQLADATGEHVPLLPAMLAGRAEDQGEGSAIPAEPHHTPIDLISSTSQPSIPSTTEEPHLSPPRIIDRQDTKGWTVVTFMSLHSGPMKHLSLKVTHQEVLRTVCKELMAIVPKMVTKIDSLEKELKETKQTLGNAVLTLVKKVKSLEVALKRMSNRVILSDSEDEETENQWRKFQDIDDDPLVSLVVSQSVSTYKRKTRSANKGKEIGTGLDFFSAVNKRLNSAKVKVNTKVIPGSAGVNIGNTPVSTHSVFQIVNVTIPSPDEEVARRVHLDALLAKRIQEEKELSEQQQKRKAEVQEATQYYTEEDWDTIRAKLEANAE